MLAFKVDFTRTKDKMDSRAAIGCFEVVLADFFSVWVGQICNERGAPLLSLPTMPSTTGVPGWAMCRALGGALKDVVAMPPLWGEARDATPRLVSELAEEKLPLPVGGRPLASEAPL